MHRELLKELDSRALQHAWQRYHETGHGFRDIEIGLLNVWEALEYEIVEAFYVAYFKSSHFNAGIRRDLKALLLRGQWNTLTLRGILDGRFWPVGHLLETSQTIWRSGFFQKSRQNRRRRPDVLLCGYLKSGPTWWEEYPKIQKQGRLHCEALRYDDYFRRQFEILDRNGMPSTDGVSLITGRDIQWGAQLERSLYHASKFGKNTPWGDPISLRRMARYVRRVALQYRVTERAISEWRPRVCVIPDEREPLARLVAKLTHQLGIPTISVPEVGDQWLRRIPPRSIYSNVFCVSDSAVADHLCRAERLGRRLGRDVRKKIYFTNFPEFDQIVPLPPLKRKHPPSVLFVCQGLEEEPRMIRQLAALVDASFSAELVIRPHPKQSLLFLRTLYRGLKVSREQPRNRALQNASLIVTHSSLLALDVVIMGRPVVIWNPSGCPELLPLIANGYARWAYDIDSLKHVLQEVFSGRGHRKLPLDQRFSLDRIIDMFLENGKEGRFSEG